jgi:hypothetical protein
MKGYRFDKDDILGLQFSYASNSGHKVFACDLLPESKSVNQLERDAVAVAPKFSAPGDLPQGLVGAG